MLLSFLTLEVPPLSHLPQLQNHNLPGRMPTKWDGGSFQTLPCRVITAHFPAATGRHLLLFKGTMSVAYLWFNFCFLLHSSPQNCWRRTLGLPTASSQSGSTGFSMRLRHSCLLGQPVLHTPIPLKDGLQALQSCTWEARGPGPSTRDLGKGGQKCPLSTRGGFGHSIFIRCNCCSLSCCLHNFLMWNHLRLTKSCKHS